MSMRKRAPRWFDRVVGPVCEAGQHENCAAVSDPYDCDEDRAVWVCACNCHEICRLRAKAEGPSPTLPATEEGR